MSVVEGGVEDRIERTRDALEIEPVDERLGVP